MNVLVIVAALIVAVGVPAVVMARMARTEYHWGGSSCSMPTVADGLVGIATCLLDAWRERRAAS